MRLQIVDSSCLLCSLITVSLAVVGSLPARAQQPAPAADSSSVELDSVQTDIPRDPDATGSSVSKPSVEMTATRAPFPAKSSTLETTPRDETSSAGQRSTSNEDQTNTFAGIRFGVGITLTLDAWTEDRVQAASVVNGIVRVEETKNSVARVMLESHYLFTTDWAFLAPAGSWGWGPFIGLQPGTDNLIEAVAAGLMLGFKRSEEKAESWNIGIGIAVDPAVRQLGDGIVENQPLPPGETSVRFKTTSASGILVLGSFTF